MSKYEEIWNSPEEKKYELVVIGDTNDADYITEISEIGEKELQALLPLFETIKNFEGRYNWPTSRYADEDIEELYPDFDEDDFDLLNERIPHGEDGIHTIESVVYYPIPTKVKVI